MIPTTLTSLEVVRKRPAMYVGPLDSPFLPTKLLQEGLCLFLGHGGQETSCTTIRVELGDGDGRAFVQGDGPGLPMHDVNGKPFAELLLTRLFACRDAKRPGDQEVCQIGVTVLVALCSSFEAKTFSEGFEWTMLFEAGVALGPFLKGAPTTRQGTELRFQLDAAIVQHRSFDAACLRWWAKRHFPCVEMTVL